MEFSFHHLGKDENEERDGRYSEGEKVSLLDMPDGPNEFVEGIVEGRRDGEA